MKISIQDNANARLIVCAVPEYLLDGRNGLGEESLFDAIADALGLDSSNCNFMLGDFEVVVQSGLFSEVSSIGDLVQDFEIDAMQALENAIADEYE